MTPSSRKTLLAVYACAMFVAIAVGCGSTSPAGGGGGAGGNAGASARGGASGSAGAGGAAGTTGIAGAAGTTGVAGAAGGAAGRGGAAGGAAGAAGRGGAAGGAAGAAGATGVAGAAGTPGDAGTLICQANEMCTAGASCQTECGTGATPTRTVCTCAPSGGNRNELACVTLPCNRDAGANDAGTAFPTCAAGTMNDGDCTSPADTVCTSACMTGMQMRCICVPRGGGGGARWMCGARTACQ